MLNESRQEQNKQWTIETLNGAIKLGQIFRGETISLAGKRRDFEGDWIISKVVPILPLLSSYHIKLDLSNNKISPDEVIAIARCLEQCTEGSLELNLSHNSFGNLPLLVFANVLPRCSIKLLINFTNTCQNFFDNRPLLNFIKAGIEKPANYLCSNSLLLLGSEEDLTCIFKIFPKEIIRKISYLTHAATINDLCQNSIFKDFTSVTKADSLAYCNSNLFLRTLQQTMICKWPMFDQATFDLNCEKLKINFNIPHINLRTFVNSCNETGFYEFITEEHCANYSRRVFSNKNKLTDDRNDIIIKGRDAVEFFAVYVCGVNPNLICFPELESEHKPKSKENCSMQ